MVTGSERAAEIGALDERTKNQAHQLDKMAASVEVIKSEVAALPVMLRKEIRRSIRRAVPPAVAAETKARCEAQAEACGLKMRALAGGGPRNSEPPAGPGTPSPAALPADPVAAQAWGRVWAGLALLAVLLGGVVAERVGARQVQAGSGDRPAATAPATP